MTEWTKPRLSHFCGLAPLAAVLIALSWQATAAQPSNSTTDGPAAETAIREGATLSDQVGVFQVVGDRVVFVVDGAGRQLTALENLALERVARAVRQSSSPQMWLVSGTVTEYQGGNFLLIERAIIRRSVAEPTGSRR